MTARAMRCACGGAVVGAYPHEMRRGSGEIAFGIMVHCTKSDSCSTAFECEFGTEEEAADQINASAYTLVSSPSSETWRRVERRSVVAS